MSGRITWYCGTSWEPWSPQSLRTGIAGSQTAVIQLSREWARRGYEVRVYCFLKGPEQEYDGVRYLPVERFDPRENAGLLIIWRHTNLGVLNEAINADAIYVELQDHAGADALAAADLSRVDKLFLKSEFHATLFPRLPEAKIVLLPNGVDRAFLELPISSKSPFRMVYASNYYRGLEPMLEFGWPLVKREIPEAELHVFYGWELFDLSRPDKRGQRWKEALKARIQDAGVTDHGRVGQDRLMREKAQSVIHYYGCVWPETDCISVRESALVECVPVTTEFAALGAKPYCTKVPGDPRAKDTQEAVAAKVIELLSDPAKLEQARTGIRDLAARETWDRVANSWLAEFT